MTLPSAPPVLSSSEAHLFSDESLNSAIPQAIPSTTDLKTRFDIDSTISKLRAGNYKQIALQFPDELLYVSTAVCELLRDGVNAELKESGDGERRVFILADTSYGACCVDEVAAEHGDADVIVHFGRACLSPTARLPVIYVFGKEPLPGDATYEDIVKDITARIPDRDEKVLLHATPSLEWHLSHLQERLQSEGYQHVFVSEPTENPQAAIPNHTLPESHSDYTVYYLSLPSPPVLLTLYTHFSQVYTFPPTPLSPRQMLARRYALTRSILSAKIIGILVNTLSVSRYLSTLSTVRKLITDAGKASYTFVVGKLNTPKLANFEEVDVWVAVGCWEQDIVGQEGRGNDFWKPVVNVLELEVGLGKRSWGAWRGGFDLEEEKAAEAEAEGIDDDESEDEMEYDLRTRRLVPKVKKLRITENGAPSKDANSTALTTTNNQNALTLAGGVISASTEYMQERRTWRGLGSDWVDIEYEGAEDGKVEGAELETGRGLGVAKGYSGEGEGTR